MEFYTMKNDYDVEGKWIEFVEKLNEVNHTKLQDAIDKTVTNPGGFAVTKGYRPDRYENKKTYDGDPRGNYDVRGDFNKLAPDETASDYYSQEEVDGPSAPPQADPVGERPFMTGDIDGKDHFEVERALRDAMDALGEADPADVYEKLMALRDMIDLMPAP